MSLTTGEVDGMGTTQSEPTPRLMNFCTSRNVAICDTPPTGYPPRVPGALGLQSTSKAKLSLRVWRGAGYQRLESCQWEIKTSKLSTVRFSVHAFSCRPSRRQANSGDIRAPNSEDPLLTIRKKPHNHYGCRARKWSRLTDSNRRPTDYKFIS